MHISRVVNAILRCSGKILDSLNSHCRDHSNCRTIPRREVIYFLIEAWRLQVESTCAFQEKLCNYLATNAVHFLVRENVKNMPAVIFNQNPNTH